MKKDRHDYNKLLNDLEELFKIKDKIIDEQHKEIVRLNEKLKRILEDKKYQPNIERR